MPAPKLSELLRGDGAGRVQIAFQHLRSFLPIFFPDKQRNIQDRQQLDGNPSGNNGGNILRLQNVPGELGIEQRRGAGESAHRDQLHVRWQLGFLSACCLLRRRAGLKRLPTILALGRASNVLRLTIGTIGHGGNAPSSPSITPRAE